MISTALNEKVIDNYSKLKPSIFLLPLILLLLIVIFLFFSKAISTENYVAIQKNLFFYINHHLGQFPKVILNVTQLGDASIMLSFLTIFIIYAPKIWQALITASIISTIFSTVLKNIFLVPRPSEALDNDSFIIIGKAAVGFASLPSGHSITIFTTLTVLFFAFYQKKITNRLLCVFGFLFIGISVALTRVGVGAHYPIDISVGSIVGFISGLIGIFVCQKISFLNWINNKKYYPIFMILILACGISIIFKILDDNLIIFYLALISLAYSLYKITYLYVKK